MYWKKNVVIFFPGDEIPDPLPKHFLYLYVSAKFKGDMHNRYTPVHEMLEHMDGSRVYSHLVHMFDWIYTDDQTIDDLFSRDINIMRHTPNLGVAIFGRRIAGTFTQLIELETFAHVLQVIRKEIAYSWQLFVAAEERPHEASTILMERLQYLTTRTIEDHTRHGMHQRHVKIELLKTIYGLSVQIGSEHFFITSSTVDHHVTVNLSKPLAEMLANIVGMENIGTGNIYVDRERTWESAVNIAAYGIARTIRVKYEYLVIE